MTEIKHYFFDMDDTIYDQLEPFRLSLVNEGIWVDKDRADFEALYKRVRYHSDELWDDYCAGKLTLEATRRLRLQLAFEELQTPIDDAYADVLQAAYEREQRSIKPYSGILPLFQALREKGCDIGVITNGPVKHQTNKINALGIEPHVNDGWLFVSDAVGIAKPDPRIFHEVNRMTGTLPENCLYIGDNWRNDIVGASDAGWQCVWLNTRGRGPESEHQPAHECADIESLAQWILQGAQPAAAR
ncbi:HAD-superfamily hydrolase, subfamily IA, variant 1 [Paenibacillus curdlanolyticus YK9]|uniref:HAD-superfamily hydrolase, subfamily IA, variant 1 n=1 Tax=Paenibacillus curdlanolyticus YK9 TaxID=717606 RepID=E0I678_9BACL|nr:HAD family hydrolase [Paenibacillus curdlanolyticus]EFM12470.1 HAD-superfamily hydrolase, subfamily IA, variant 1 [Paenibacillus curdlanolyticus YK9]